MCARFFAFHLLLLKCETIQLKMQNGQNQIQMLQSLSIIFIISILINAYKLIWPMCVHPINAMHLYFYNKERVNVNRVWCILNEYVERTNVMQLDI